MRRFFWLVAMALQGAGTVLSAEKAERLEFTRMIAHLAGYGDPGYLEFIADTEPDLVQFGFYGAHFFNLVHTPQYGGYPARFPVRGVKECGQWFDDHTKKLHKMGVKVIGHFNVGSLTGDPDSPEGPRGFFDFYRNHWDEAELGPKPVDDPAVFLERDASGQPLIISEKAPGGPMKEYYACLRNPHWQAVLRAWMKRAIDRGVDGLIANRFYRHNCLCEHCQADFRAYLAKQFRPSQLKSLFGIEKLDTHVFEEIVSWHPPEESTPLRLEMLRWSQLSNKRVYDELFIDFGRSLKPDLIIAQWDHLGDFSQIKGDERCLLPHGIWGAGEDYLWYSTGASAVYSDLKQGVLADATLQARYVRGAFDDKPYTLGKYENVRIRSAIAELAANGGAPMGLYANFTDPDARAVFVRYYGFLKRYDALYRGNWPHAEAKLLFPRKAVQKGDSSAIEVFRQAGRALLDRHVLFAVEPDDVTRGGRNGQYTAEFRGEDDTLSRFETTPFVRVSANRPASGGEIDLHFVNYNREELPPRSNGQPNPGKGGVDEKPIAAPGVKVDFALPPNFEPESVEFITPESPDPRAVEFQREGDRLRFTTPEFLVYGVARMIEAPKKTVKVAGVTTVYRVNSHADMLLGRIAQTDTVNDRGDRLPLELSSVYAEQVPENDISRRLAAEGRFRIAGSIAEALTGSSGKLAVDGVFLVAEHGEYPESDTGQFIFPKRPMFEEIVKVFRESGRVAPVFLDKHLADNWKDAKWIYDTSKEMKIPLMAGSSIPLGWRYPAVDLKRDARVKEIMAVNYGRLDAYGFHALEAMQCLVERRAGGETGIVSARAYKGEAVWEAQRAGVFDRRLLDETLTRFRERPIPEGKTIDEMLRREPVLFHFVYEDGLRANILTLNGVVAEWAAAWRYGDDQTESLAFAPQDIRPFYNFAHLMRHASDMMHSGKTPWPVERTLLTTGALDAALISLRDGGRVVETPYLKEIEYRTEWNWHQPNPPPPAHNDPPKG